MILDAGTLELANAMERLALEPDVGAVKAELHQSVLEVSTDPCADVTEAGAQLRWLRRAVRERAAGHDLAIASAGTHPFSRWEDQRISPEQRYRELITDIG